MNINLRDVRDSDLGIFFEYQQDKDAVYMAAFTSKDPADKEAFLAHWTKIRANDAIIIKTIIVDKIVVGYVLTYVQAGQREITYWIGKSYWGKGITSKAVSLYLLLIKERPVFARVAKDNIGSKRVLEKCGFKIIGDDKGFANARDKEIEEYIMQLEQLSQ